MRYRHTLIIYSVAHFITKYICYYLIFDIAYRADNGAYTLISLLILYNVISRILQLASCYISDKFGVMSPAVTGCVIMLAGLLLKSVSGELAVSLCGIGSAFVYAAGAKDAVSGSDENGYQLGVYVSLGVLGAVFGYLAGKYEFPYPIVQAMPVLVGISVFLGCRLYPVSKTAVKPKAVRYHFNSKINPYVSLICAMAVIFFICYLGMSAVFINGFSFACTMSCACAVCVGIAGGSYAAYKYGARVTCVYSLMLAVPFMLFYNSVFMLSLGFMFLAGVSVSTVYGVCSKLKKRPGFALSLAYIPLSAGVCISCFRISAAIYIPMTIVMILASSFAMQYLFGDNANSFIPPEMRKAFSGMKTLVLKKKEK